ncbi:hypothetical protein D3C79_798620 [compost metagenome]
MQDTSGETLEPGKVRHMRRGEMPAGDHHIIEHLLNALADCVVVGVDRKGTAGLIKAHGFDRRVEANVIAHTGLFHPALNIVPEHLTRRIRRNWPPEMLIETVVGELQALLRPV